MAHIDCRFPYPSWQITVEQRGKKKQILLPDNLDKIKVSLKLSLHQCYEVIFVGNNVQDQGNAQREGVG